MKGLRTGNTTGLCAAAAAKAAATALLSSGPVTYVEVKNGGGALVRFPVTETARKNGTVICAVKKDAGDDPDITNGIKVFAAISKTDREGVEIDGGEGIGRVTKPGLKVEVGKAAINPVPLEMIRAAIEEAREPFGYTGGLKAVISVPDGAEIAKRTMNERLGIVGGLSILGTTGVVEPMSLSAVVETIKAEIDVRIALGEKDLLVTPGNYGRDFAEKNLGLNIEEAVKCSNYIGEALDYACMKGVPRFRLIGHAGKLVKLAGGLMNTHSSFGDCRMEIIAAHAALAGAGQETIRQIMSCVTTDAAIDILIESGISKPVLASIGEKLGFHLRERTKGKLCVEYIIFTQMHGVLIRGDTAEAGSGGQYDD